MVKLEIDKEYVNRNNERVRIMQSIGGSKFHGYNYEKLCTQIFKDDGFCEGHYDLIAPYVPKRTGEVWMNVYDAGNYVCFKSKEQADDYVLTLEGNGSKRLACINVKWTEGEGL